MVHMEVRQQDVHARELLLHGRAEAPDPSARVEHQQRPVQASHFHARCVAAVPRILWPWTRQRPPCAPKGDLHDGWASQKMATAPRCLPPCPSIGNAVTSIL